jgi:hypothetical protein
MMNLALTLDDFRACEWAAIIATSADKECIAYCEAFRAKAEQARTDVKGNARRVFELLSEVCSFGFEPRQIVDPFPSKMTLGNARWPIPTDISENDLDILGALAFDIQDPELRARIADLIWVRKRDHRHAELAIDAYLSSALTLENGPVFEFSIHRMERALRLSVMLRNEQLFNRVVGHIEAAIDRQQSKEPLRCTHLMELLIEFRTGDAPTQAARAKASAEGAAARGDFEAARRFWSLAFSLFSQFKDEANRKASQAAAAETYVSQANFFERATPPNYGLVCHHLGMAIDAYKRIGGHKARIDELHARLEAAQPHSMDQMKITASDPIELNLEPAIALVRGKSLHEALRNLAASYKPISVSGLRRIVEGDAQQTPLIHSLAAKIISSEGKVIAQRPSMLSTDPIEKERAAQGWMLQQAHMLRASRAQGWVVPALQQILMEHPVRESDFEPIVRDNFFVPSGREPIFRRGLYAGLTTDFMVASHLLIPQLENSFRVVLGRNGVITTKIENGVEREMYMHEFLYMPEFAQTFGDDLSFELRGLLIERASSNLRHGTSHGLFDYEVFTSSDALYLWWVALRLCFTQQLQTATFPQNLEEASAAPIRTTDGPNQCTESPTDAKGSDG